MARSLLDEAMIMLFEDFDPEEEEQMIDGIFDRATDLLDIVIDPEDGDDAWEEYMASDSDDLVAKSYPDETDDITLDSDDSVAAKGDASRVLRAVPLKANTVVDAIPLKANMVVDAIPLQKQQRRVLSTPLTNEVPDLSAPLRTTNKEFDNVPLTTTSTEVDAVPLKTKAAIIDEMPLKIDSIIKDEKLKYAASHQKFKLTASDDTEDDGSDDEEDPPFGTTDPNTQMVISIRLLVHIRRVLDRLVSFVNKDRMLSATKEVVVQLLDVLSEEHEVIVLDADRTKKIAHQVYNLATSIKQYMKEKRNDLLDVINRKEDESNRKVEEKKVDIALSNPEMVRPISSETQGPRSTIQQMKNKIPGM